MDEKFDGLVLNFLRRCGVPAAARCNLIILEAVRYVYEHPMSIYGGWTTAVLPAVSEACGAGRGAIENSIRNAIRSCYEADNGATLELGLGISHKPKPKELVGRLAEVIKNELE